MANLSIYILFCSLYIKLTQSAPSSNRPVQFQIDEFVNQLMTSEKFNEMADFIADRAARKIQTAGKSSVTLKQRYDSDTKQISNNKKPNKEKQTYARVDSKIGETNQHKEKSGKFGNINTEAFLKHDDSSQEVSLNYKHMTKERGGNKDKARGSPKKLNKNPEHDSVEIFTDHSVEKSNPTSKEKTVNVESKESKEKTVNAESKERTVNVESIESKENTVNAESKERTVNAKSIESKEKTVNAESKESKERTVNAESKESKERTVSAESKESNHRNKKSRIEKNSNGHPVSSNGKHSDYSNKDSIENKTVKQKNIKNISNQDLSEDGTQELTEDNKGAGKKHKKATTSQTASNNIVDNMSDLENTDYAKLVEDTQEPTTLNKPSKEVEVALHRALSDTESIERHTAEELEFLYDSIEKKSPLNKPIRKVNQEIRTENGKLFQFVDSPDYEEYHEIAAKHTSKNNFINTY